MTDAQASPRRAAGSAPGGPERPVLATGALRRSGRLAVLPIRHAARTAAAATPLSRTRTRQADAPAAAAPRLSRTATDQVAARTAAQLFTTLGELKGGAAKLGQAMAVFEAAMPEEVAAPYRSALRRLTDAAPPLPAGIAGRVVAADLAD